MDRKRGVVRRKRDKEDNNSKEALDIKTSLQSSQFHLNFEVNQKFQLKQTHQNIIDTINDEHTKMVFVDGPAGSAKSYMGVYCALMALKNKTVDKIYYIRSIVESASKQIGSLPGEIDNKFLPWTMPLIEKVSELTNKYVSDNLFASGMLVGMPVNFTRGLTFNRSFVIIDEFQNLTVAEMVTLLTRFGRKSKYVVLGDSSQADIGKTTCIDRILKCFDNDESIKNNIHAYSLTKDDIVRSEILKFIVAQLERHL